MAFAVERHGRWDRRLTSVEPGTIDGVECWRVHTDPAPQPGEPVWAFEIDGHLTYFICMSDGRCMGVRSGTARHLFPNLR